MNIIEKRIRLFVKLAENDMVDTIKKKFTLQEIAEATKILKKILALKTQSTHKYKQYCKKSKRKDILEIVNKTYLSEEDRVYLAIYIATNNG